MQALGRLPGAASRPLRAAARRGSLGSRLATRRASTVCLMGGYQYQRRLDRLQHRGLPVHDFGGRVLKEQCYGEDVIALQQYLGEQGYFNSRDGLTGYFGSVTREAVQNWQRDQGLPVTGVFNQECKWAYLKQQEAKAAELARPVASVPAAAPAQLLSASPLPGFLSWQLIYFGAGALVTATLFSLSRPPARRSPLPPNPLPAIGRFLLSALRLAASAAAAVGTLVFGATLALLGGGFALLRATARVTATTIVVTLGITVSLLRFLASVAGTGFVMLARATRSAYATAARAYAYAQRGAEARLLRPAAAHANRPAAAYPVAEEDLLLQEEEEELAARLAYAKARAAAAAGAAAPARGAREAVATAPAARAAPAAAVQRGGGLEPAAPARAARPASRLSEEELQKRIAPMKADDAGRASNSVQRPAPRPLPDRQSGSDPFSQSKYGKYYGGRQVREQIKEYLDDKRGPTPGNGPARRMEALGYPIGSQSRPARKPRKPSDAPSKPLNPVAAAKPLNPPAAPAPVPAGPAFEDVSDPLLGAGSNRASASAMATSGPAASRLLAGTELEGLPESPLRPVRVVRPGASAPPSYGGEAGPAGSAPGARPVPVVKSRQLTVGEMLRAAEEEEEEGALLAGPVPVQRPVPVARDEQWR